MNILLMDDNPAIVEVALLMLKALSCETAVAANAPECLLRASSGGFDAALVDCHMPVMDGFEITREIRRNESKSSFKTHLPIIAMTADNRTADREICVACGMDDFLSKPVRLQELQAVLGKFDPKVLRLSATPTTANPPDTAEGSVWDSDYALMMADGDAAINDKILRMFLEWSKYTERRLQAALCAGDLKMIKYEGHSIAGAAANVGAMRVCQRGHEIQEAGESEDVGRAKELKKRLDTDLAQVIALISNHLKLDPSVHFVQETSAAVAVKT